MPPQSASVRILGGESRGRKISVPTHRQLRPSGSRVRESLFNCLGQRLDGHCCLDLFAGSGVLGLEAASRGAAHVVFVEQRRKTAATIRTAANTMNVHATVMAMPAEKFLSGRQEEFDLIFLDPPYADYPSADSWNRLLTAVSPFLRAGGRIYREGAAPFAPPPPWEATADKRAGRVFWQILRKVT